MSGNNPAELSQEVLIDGKKYKLTGTVDFSDLQITKVDDDIPDPEPPTNPPTEPGTEPPVVVLPPTTQPTEGTIKPGGWGADLINKDKWHVVNMRDFPEQFKVVDGAGKNVATNFKTKEVAENFIAYFKVNPFPPTTTQPPIEPPVEPEKPTEPPASGTGVDKNGVKLLVSDGKTITYDYEKDTRKGKNDGIRYNMKNVGKWEQSEVTGYFKFEKDPVDDEVSIKWSQVPHSGRNMVNCYDSGVSIKNGKTRLRMELKHPDYSGALATGQGSPLKDKWIGYKGIKTVGTDGSVTIKLYQDTGDNEGDKPANQWKEIFSHVDKKYKINGPHPELTLRVDDPGKKGQKNLREKWISAAKI